MAIGVFSLHVLVMWGLAIRRVASSPLFGPRAQDDSENPLPAPTPATCPAGHQPSTTQDPLWYQRAASTSADWRITYYNAFPVAGGSELTLVSLVTTLAEDPATATSYPHVFRRTRGTKYITVATYTDLETDCTSTSVELDSKTVTDTFTAFVSDPVRHMAATATDFAEVPCPGVAEGESGEEKRDEEEEVDETEEHADCVALGMNTGCIGQCALGGAKDDLFICPHNTYDQVPDLSMGLGRVCWAPNGTVHALHSPCLKGDSGMGCKPGQADYRPLRPSPWI